MRSLTAGGLAALWLAAAVASAQPPAARADKPEKDDGSWWSGLFGSKPKADPKTQAAEPTKTVADKAAEHDRLRRSYMRRLMVCTRLREVALESGNDALEDEANRLEQMAWRLYTEGSAKLLGVAAVGMDLEEPDDEAPAARPARKPAPVGPLPPRLRNGGAMEARTGAGREGER